MLITHLTQDDRMIVHRCLWKEKNTRLVLRRQALALSGQLRFKFHYIQRIRGTENDNEGKK